MNQSSEVTGKRSKRYSIISGYVDKWTGDGRTKRPRWRAVIAVRNERNDRRYQAAGEGSSPHVALKRAAEEVIAKAETDARRR